MKRIGKEFLAVVVLLALLGLLGALGQVGQKTPKDTNETQVAAVSAVRVGERLFSVELAISEAQKAAGLSNRKSLSQGSGMLFVFKSAEQPVFWMKDMLFPLDIVWIYQGKVVDITRGAAPPEPGTPLDELPLYQSSFEVDYVLEINVGEADGLEVGDRVEIVDSFTA